MVTFLELERTDLEVDNSEVPLMVEKITASYLTESTLTYACRFLYCRVFLLTLESTLAECVKTLSKSLRAGRKEGIQARSITVECNSPVDVDFVERLQSDISVAGSFGFFQDQRSIRMIDGEIQTTTFIYVFGDGDAADAFFHLRATVGLPIVAYVDPNAENMPDRIKALDNFSSDWLEPGSLVAFNERSNQVLRKWSLNQSHNSLICALREFQNEVAQEQGR